MPLQCREAKERGLAVIFITHNLYHVYPVADSIVVLYHVRKIGDFCKEEVTLEAVSELIATGTSTIGHRPGEAYQPTGPKEGG